MDDVTSTGTVDAKLAYSPREAARALGVSARTLFTFTKRGAIPHVRLGRRVLYPVAELRAWMRRTMTAERTVDAS